MCKEERDTWIVSQIRKLSETFELVMPEVKGKSEQMVEDVKQRASDGKNILKCQSINFIKKFFKVAHNKQRRMNIRILRHIKIFVRYFMM